MARQVIVGPRLLASCSRIGLRPGTPRAQLLKRTIDSLGAEELPATDDYQAGIPPVMTAWVRPITRVSLWLYYRFDAEQVVVLLLKDYPPERLS